jgi:transposase-like protein/IS1 family transposase
MNCPNCNSLAKKHGKDRNGNQRFRCLACGKTYIEPKDKPLGNMYLSEEKAIQCLKALVEGNSIRSTERMTDVNRNTILSLIETVGKKCLWIQENLVKNVKVSDVQADEIWAFIGMKQKTANDYGLTDEEKVGSAYTFTAIESHSKLIVAWHLGKRSEQDALIFLEKLYTAIDGATNRFQMSTDGFKGYDHTVNEVLGTKADYGQVIKIYGKQNPDEVRYSSGDVIEIRKKIICGKPNEDNISTSYVERSNLTMRMSIRRFTRLTNAFSKKWENHNYALALHFAHYNFCRIHKTIRCTPAMEAGLTKTVWSLKDLLKFNS